MADDAGSRRPSQPPTPVSPAGVGASASNRGSPRAMVSPSILQEILESGDQPLIDDALEQWDTTAMGQLLSTLPSPTRGASPAGVGSAASNRSSPSPATPRHPQERSPSPQGWALVVAGEAAVAAVVADPLRPVPPVANAAREEEVTPRPRPHPHPHPHPWQPVPREDDLNKLKRNHAEDADVAEDEDVQPAPTRHPPCRGPPPLPRNKSPLKRLSIKPICNDGYACYSKTKKPLRQDDASPTSPPPTAS